MRQICGLLSAFWLFCYSNFSLATVVETTPKIDWHKQYQHFADDAPTQQIFQYFKLITLFANWAEDQLCSDFHFKKMDEALAINPASLHIRYMRFTCWQEQQNTTAIAAEIEILDALGSMLLQQNTGTDASRAIAVRELGEAYALLGLSDFVVLETELLSYQQELLFRLYVRDAQNNNFQYRYFTAHHWLRQIMQRSGATSITVSDVTAAAYKDYLDMQLDFALLFQAKQFVLTQQYDKAATILTPMVERSYLATTMLAQLYLLQKNNTKLEELVPELISAHEAGEPSASAMLALMVLVYDDSAAALVEATQLLQEYAGEEDAGLYQEILLDLIGMHPNFVVLTKRWLGKTPSIMQQDALQRVADINIAASLLAQQQRGMQLHQLWLQFTNKGL